jgi:hypothetical protein
MKKISIIAIALMLTMGFTVYGWAAIEGTPHDVNVMVSGGGSDLERCAMCHTPHSGTGDYPLWNREQATQVYTMYESPTYDMGTGALNGPSTLCMVCHNGVASQLVNYPGPGSAVNTDYDFDDTYLNAPWSNLGTGMKDDHPISFTYNPTGDYDDNGFPIVATGTSGRKFVDGSLANYPLYGGTAATPGSEFECSSCHAVHHTPQDSYDPALTGEVFFLRISNVGSQMCTDCHTNR